LPTLLKLYSYRQILVNKIVESATELCEEGRRDDHPLAAEFDRTVLSLSIGLHRQTYAEAH